MVQGVLDGDYVSENVILKTRKQKDLRTGDRGIGVTRDMDRLRSALVEIVGVW